MRPIKMAIRIFTVTLACMAIVPAFASSSIRIFSFGEYLGQGQLLVINDTDNTIEAVIGPNNTVEVVTSFEGWRFVFDNVGDGPLLEGVYEEATRYISDNTARPGMDASGDGRGCNTLNGRFVVLEADYGVGDEVIRFAADLTLSCEGNSAPFVANIRINSELPLELDVPTASAGRDRIVFERDEVALDASNSVGGSGEIVSYQWTQTGGPAVNLSSASSETPEFEAPDHAGAPVVLTFAVEVVNENDLVDTDVMTVELRDRSQPRSMLSYESQSGDPVGQSLSGYFTEDDGVFSGFTDTVGNQVTLNFDGDGTWRLFMGAHEGQQLTASTDYIVRDSIEKPYLFVTHDGRSCSNLNGGFFVYAFTQGPGDEIDGFSAAFNQTCTSAAAPLLGEIYYNVVLPEANAGQSRTELEGVNIVLDYSLSNDADGMIEQIQWEQISGPPVEFAVTADSTVAFTHALDDAELEKVFEFELLVIDETGYTDTDRVTITVVQNNQAPIATDDVITLQQGFSIDFNPLANDSDVDGQIGMAQLVVLDAPSEGLLVSGANGFNYTPSSFFSGTTTATYVVFDNDGAESNTATITLEIVPGPFGFTDSATTDAGVPVTIDILGNDQISDAAFDPASISILQQPGGGTVTVNANGSLTYTPTGTYSGQDFFSYDVADDNGLRTPATNVIVEVKATANLPPAQPVTPAVPATPITPPATPQPVQAATPAPQPQVCSDVSAWTGAKTCGGGSLSPLSFLLLGFAILRIRRRQVST